MTSMMPTEASAPGPGRILSPHGGANSLPGIRSDLDVPVGGMTNIPLEEFRCVPSNASRPIVSPASEVATTVEPRNLEPQHDDDQQASSASQERGGPSRPTIINNPFASWETGNPDYARPTTAEVAGGSTRSLTICFKLSRMWMALLIVGILFLVVVPGVILGVVTGETEWGIALSGAVISVVGVFIGLCLHYRK